MEAIFWATIFWIQFEMKENVGIYWNRICVHTKLNAILNYCFGVLIFFRFKIPIQRFDASNTIRFDKKGPGKVSSKLLIFDILTEYEGKGRKFYILILEWIVNCKLIYPFSKQLPIFFVYSNELDISDRVISSICLILKIGNWKSSVEICI